MRLRPGADRRLALGPGQGLLRRTVVLAGVGAITGCADSGYYLQSLGGQLDMLQAARPVAQWLADEAVAPALKQQLVLAQRMRDFAVAELQLHGNASYQRYADLQRHAAVWNVVAAAEFSLTLKTWCFPVMGCVAYRGYFNEADARAKGQELQREGLDVSVYAVPAYSTLGWLNWAGGDPLLNTFIHYPEGELARLIFHELAHQVLYVRDDTLFNESFATAVGRWGAARWLARYGSEAARREHARRDTRRREFRALCQATRHRLDALYRQQEAPAVEPSRLRADKKRLMQEFLDHYGRLRRSWGEAGAGYDAWVAEANNAAFGVQAAYEERVPVFEALLARGGQEWPPFHESVRQLATLPAAERQRALQQLATEQPDG